jgi:hypothetical protein
VRGWPCEVDVPPPGPETGDQSKARVPIKDQEGRTTTGSLKVKNGTLMAADFKTGQLPAGPQGPKGDNGDVGAQGAQGIQELGRHGSDQEERRQLFDKNEVAGGLADRRRKEQR